MRTVSTRFPHGVKGVNPYTEMASSPFTNKSKIKNILYIKSSILGDNSKTNEVLDHLYATWLKKHASAVHVTHDLGANPLPHLTGAHLAAAPAEGLEALKELQEADTVVITAPMYNFGIPSALKAWVDHITKAGVTFRYTDAGPEGLLKGKRAILVVGTGGVYSEGPYKAADFVEPYLRTVLGFVGITDVTVVRVEGVALGGDVGAQSLVAAKAVAASL